MAQLAEQLICNQQVIGSSPIIGLHGWVPERPKGADCKSVVSDFGGSNPPPPTKESSNEGSFLLPQNGFGLLRLLGIIVW